MGKLEDFLKSFGYDEFKKAIASVVSVTDAGPGLVTCKCAGDLHKIISGFLKANPKLAEKFTRNNDVEKEYLEKLEVAKSEAEKVIADAKTVRNIGKIKEVFEGLFELKSPLELLIVKQYEQRLKIRIEKYPFPKDSEDLIYEGLFLAVVVHCLAKKDKAAAEAAELASEGKPATAKKDTIEPKKQPMNEVLNNPNFIKDTIFSYVGAPRLYFNKKSLDDNFLKTFVACYADGVEAPDVAQDGDFVPYFSNWIDEHSEEIQAISQFRKEVQEDPHEVLITEDNKNDRNDPFVSFVLRRGVGSARMLQYPYFFNGSEKKELSLNGKKIGNITGYTYPKGVDILKAPSVSELDKLLKPIWFRDATDGEKSYKKVSAKKLHELGDAYISLLEHNDIKKDIIKYIRITYQCEKDKILVSFTTNNFDLPPQVDSEADFKNRFKANTGRALYRGMSDAKQFEDMKKRGISSNARHHHEQYYGPGLYWTKEFKQAKDSFAREIGAVVAMAVACEDFPDIIKDAVDNQQYRELFLMRNNQCLFIRPTAMCDARGKPAESIDRLKKSTDYKNVVFCSTNKEIEDWLNCK